MPRSSHALASVLTIIMILVLGQAVARDHLWQTNAKGDDIHIYDIQTQTLVKRLVVGAHPHGVAWAPGSNTVFVSLEKNGKSAGELLWINKTTYEIEHRLAVGPEPHAIAVTPDGKWVYVPCRDGTYWVIDAQARRVVTKIRTGGRPHNTTISANGHRVYLSPMGPLNQVTIVNPAENHHVLGTILFSASARPPAIASSRQLFFQHVDGLNGFEAADLKTNKRIARITHQKGLGLPVVPRMLGFINFHGLNRCHGLAVRPTDQEIWSICGANATIHAITDQGFPENRHIRLPSKGYWICFSPNGDFAFIALADKSEIAVVDARSRKIVTILKAGNHPKRNIVIFDGPAASLKTALRSPERQ